MVEGGKRRIVNSEVTTYQMSEEERMERMKVNPWRYIELKSEGLSDPDIAKRMGVAYPTLNAKKSHWGFTNCSIHEMKKKAKSRKFPKPPGIEVNDNNIDNAAPVVKEKQDAAAQEINKSDPTSQKSKEFERLNADNERLRAYSEETFQKYKQEESKAQQLEARVKEQEEELNGCQTDLERKVQSIERITQEHEVLQGHYDELKKQFDSLQEQSFHPGQIDVQASDELDKEREAHRNTKLKLEEALLNHQTVKNQIEILTSNNERLHQRFQREQETHELLAAYTQRVMPS